MSMTERTGPYEDSYPPSLWGGGGIPDPTITVLAPNTGVAGGGPYTVQVDGTRFVASSVVEAAQAPLPTTYVSATRLTATYSPSAEGAVPFTVRSGGAGGEESNAVTFTVTAAQGEPTGEPVRELPGDVAYFTVAQVQAWVDEHQHLAADVLVHEQARGADARSTLVTWLQGFIESHDGDDELLP